MTCNFDPNKCTSSCNKYSMCSFFSVQTQLSEIQTQFNFIYKTLGDILKSNDEAHVKINLLENTLYSITERIDSETK